MEKDPDEPISPEGCQECFPYHGGQLGRINRVIGQMEGVKKMIEERRYCPEILTLLRGARAAIHAVEANILETYLGSCVTDAFASGDREEREKKIGDLKSIFKRFDN